ncbi:MAG: signal peptidase I [Oscillospiraceae bacterium]|nr:signal peptidase I [Oscillospiraceae bacterium]
MNTYVICKQGEKVRDVNDFNREYMCGVWCGEMEAANKPAKGAAVKSAVFYIILLVMVGLAFFHSGDKNSGKRFGPFSYNTVLTSSMQSVYPQGSLITSWAVNPGEPLNAGLEKGTDIVFVKDNNTVVVHRIIEIMADYEDSGQRAFRTQGVDNPLPDSWVTYEGNVIGRVTWCLPYAGNILGAVADNILWVIFIIILLALILAFFKIAFKKQ